MTAEFAMRLDEGMLAYIREIADEMQSRFGISRPQAAARSNGAFGGGEFDPHPDLICHELAAAGPGGG
jgi:hypothetical protein